MPRYPLHPSLTALLERFRADREAALDSLRRIESGELKVENLRRIGPPVDETADRIAYLRQNIESFDRAISDLERQNTES